MAYIQRHEKITGTDLSGSSGLANRTYDLAYSTDKIKVTIENTPLQAGIDFSFIDDTVTFLNKVFNNQDITINYTSFI